MVWKVGMKISACDEYCMVVYLTLFVQIYFPCISDFHAEAYKMTFFHSFTKVNLI